MQSFAYISNSRPLHTVVVLVLCFWQHLLFAQKAQCNHHAKTATSSVSQQARWLTEEVFYIPVIFHVVYANETQNISDEQIWSQLQVINEDFRKNNSDTIHTLNAFKAVADDARIEFYLADADGVESITRTQTSVQVFHNNDLHDSEKGGKDVYYPARFLNIWIANLSPGTLGYASSPGDEAFRDGVAIHYEFFGRGEDAVPPFNLGRTLTHEIGHWLGLDHPWGAGGCEGDDGIEDTPVQEGPVSSCDTNFTSCGHLAMVQNFMNTGDDACMNLFTKLQCDKMRNSLVTMRPEVYSINKVVTSVTDEALPGLDVFPNPVSQRPEVFIRVAAQPGDVHLVDTTGRKMANAVSQVSEGYRFDLEGLNNGIYFASIRIGGRVYHRKIYLSL